MKRRWSNGSLLVSGPEIIFEMIFDDVS